MPDCHDVTYFTPLSHLISGVIIWCKYCYLHFTCKDSETLIGKVTCSSQSWAPYLTLFCSKVYNLTPRAHWFYLNKCNKYKDDGNSPKCKAIICSCSSYTFLFIYLFGCADLSSWRSGDALSWGAWVFRCGGVSWCRAWALGCFSRWVQ